MAVNVNKVVNAFVNLHAKIAPVSKCVTVSEEDHANAEKNVLANNKYAIVLSLNVN